MLAFMDYVQNAFLQATKWNKDNSYGSLNATSQNILDFRTPRALCLHLSSLSTSNFASSYSIGSIGLLDGSLSYLYSSKSLASVITGSTYTSLRLLVPGYRQLQHLTQPEEAAAWETWQQGKGVDRRNALLYGRLHLPQSTIEALYVRRLCPQSQLMVSCFSDSKLPSGGTLLAHFQHDTAKHCTEYLYSTDSALIGLKGLYNFGPEASIQGDPTTSVLVSTELASLKGEPLADLQVTSLPHGRFSAGGEIYYGLLNKSGGLSTGLRFATLPSHTGFPYTMTLTLNPLMGNLSSTYSVLATPTFALSSRFDFNVYSYESEIRVGTELWRKRARQEASNLDWARKKLGKKIMPPSPKELERDECLSGCLRARIDHRGSLALLWEGRMKALLYSCGVNIDLKAREYIFKGLDYNIVMLKRSCPTREKGFRIRQGARRGGKQTQYRNRRVSYISFSAAVVTITRQDKLRGLGTRNDVPETWDDMSIYRNMSKKT